MQGWGARWWRVEERRGTTETETERGTLPACLSAMLCKQLLLSIVVVEERTVACVLIGGVVIGVHGHMRLEGRVGAGRRRQRLRLVLEAVAASPSSAVVLQQGTGLLTHHELVQEHFGVSLQHAAVTGL